MVDLLEAHYICIGLQQLLENEWCPVLPSQQSGFDLQQRLLAQARPMLSVHAKRYLPSEILHAVPVHLLECSTAAPSALEQCLKQGSAHPDTFSSASGSWST